jgi:hypothetical protein
MKKHIVMISLIVASFHGLHGMGTRLWNSQQMALAGYQAFGRDWIFKNPIDGNGLQSWENECAAGLSVIGDYAKKLDTTKRALLKDYVSQINNASYDLINGVKVTYNSIFSPVARKKITTSQMLLNKKIELRPLFDDIVTKMLNLKLKVSVARKKTKSSDELAAYDIIDDVTQVIINVARTAAKSVDFLK